MTGKIHRYERRPAIPTFRERPPKKVEDCNLGPVTAVTTNYFRVNVIPKNLLVFCYQVKIQIHGKESLVNDREVGRTWFYRFLEQHPLVIDANSKQFVYNNLNILWTLRQATITDHEQTFLVKRNPDEHTTKCADVTLKYVDMMTNFDPSILTHVFQQKHLTGFFNNVITQSFQNPLIDVPFLTTARNRRIFFAPDNRSRIPRHLTANIGAGLDVWTGVVGGTNLDCEAGILYNCDLTHSLFRRQGYPIVKYYVEVIHRIVFNCEEIRKYENTLRRSGLNEKNRRQLEISLKGEVLAVDERVSNLAGRPQRFNGVADKAACVHIINDLGATAEEYFYHKHGIRLHFPHLPCIKLGRNTWVPMELCRTSDVPAVASRDIHDRIPEKIKDTLIRCTTISPLRHRDILSQLVHGDARSGVPEHLSSTNAIMDAFGVEVDKKMLDVKATMLPPPALVYGGGDRFLDKDGNGIWNVADGEVNNSFRTVLEPKTKMVVPGIIFVKPTELPDLRAFFTILDVLYQQGVNVVDRKAFVASRYNRETDDLESMVTEYKQKVAEHFGAAALPLIVFVLPFKDAGRGQLGKRKCNDYAFIKSVCDVTVGIFSQCVIKKTYDEIRDNPLSHSATLNLCMNILGKIGAQHYDLERNGPHKNWTRLTDPAEPTLVLGINITDDGVRDTRKCYNVCSVAGNIDVECMNYRVSTQVYEPGQKDFFATCEQFSERLDEFMKRTHTSPKHVVIYRDGVSNSLFSTTLQKEKQCLLDACSVLMGGRALPTVTYIVVARNHHTRFFPTRQEDCQADNFNLKAGTLVESGVTSASHYDFFLVSQYGAKGTARPAHYHVLFDSWKPSPAFWPTISHCLTYNYVACSRSISQPAPLVYAHRAAKKTLEYLLVHLATPSSGLSIRSAIRVNDSLDGMLFV